MVHRGFLSVVGAALLTVADCWSIPQGTSPKALYLISDESANAIVSLGINADGTLWFGNKLLTGGEGGIGATAMNTSAGPDPLFSQGAVSVAGNIVGTVNAGDNTFSLFEIDELSPTNLTQLGSKADTMGEFPNSIALHPNAPVACISNIGLKSGVSCFRYNTNGTIIPQGDFRPIQLNGTTVPPSGPATDSITQISFSEDGSTLFAHVKQAGSMVASQYYTYQVDAVSGYVSEWPVISNLDGINVLFGGVPIPESEGAQYFVTDASQGAFILGFDQTTYTAKVSSLLKVPGSKAPCWTAYNPQSRSFFIGDAGVQSYFEVTLPIVSTDGTADVPTPELAAVYNVTAVTGNTNPGMLDSTVVDGFVYGISPAGADNGTVFINIFDGSAGSGKGVVKASWPVPSIEGRFASGLASYPNV